MQIISKFSDYYDGVSAAYPDPEDRKWIRKTENISRSDPRWELFQDFHYYYDTMPWYKGYSNLGIRRVVLGFCGKIYCFYEVDDLHWFETPNQVLQFLLKEQKKKIAELENNLMQLHSLQYWERRFNPSELHKLMKQKPTKYTPYPFNDIGWRRWKSNHKIPQKHQPFIELNSPILLFKEPEYSYQSPIARVNPDITPFKRIMDPHTAYQELDMYLSNVLVQHNDPAPTTGSDEIIRDSKGFDEHSFKSQAPGLKKDRRKRNKARKQRVRNYHNRK